MTSPTSGPKPDGAKRLPFMGVLKQAILVSPHLLRALLDGWDDVILYPARDARLEKGAHVVSDGLTHGRIKHFNPRTTWLEDMRTGIDEADRKDRHAVIYEFEFYAFKNPLPVEIVETDGVFAIVRFQEAKKL